MGIDLLYAFIVKFNLVRRLNSDVTIEHGVIMLTTIVLK